MSLEVQPARDQPARVGLGQLGALRAARDGGGRVVAVDRDRRHLGVDERLGLVVADRLRARFDPPGRERSVRDAGKQLDDL